MVINEKALVRQMKEAYKTYGYTVAVVGERMMLTNGFWLASIDVDNVPAALLGMLAEHIRDVPKESSAIYMIDPRYAVLFDDHNQVVRLGGGIYAEGEISELWVMRFTEGELEEKISHLEKIPWVK